MFFGKKSANVGRCRIRFVHLRIFGCMRYFRLIVAPDKLFGFVDCNLTLDIFTRGFDKVIGRLQAIDGLQPDCGLPCITFFPFLRFALAYVFVEVNHNQLLFAMPKGYEQQEHYQYVPNVSFGRQKNMRLHHIQYS